MKKIRSLFLGGLLLLLPLFITGYIIYILAVYLNRLLYLIKIPTVENPYIAKAAALVLVLLAVIFLGIFAKNYVGRKVIMIYEYLLSKMPVINKIYDTTKNIINMIALQKNDINKGVVLVEYPKEGSYSIGFLTNNKVRSLGQGKANAVFIPTTPNPTSGFLIFLPDDKIEHLDMSFEEAFKMIVSGGMIEPADHVKPAHVPRA